MARVPVDGSLRLDVGGPDQLAPLVCELDNELAKVNGRDCKSCNAKFGKPLFYPCIGKPRVDFVVEPIDYFRRRVPRGTDPNPKTTLVAWYSICDCWSVRQSLQSRCGSYGQSAQPTCFDVLNCRRQGGNYSLQLTTEEIGESGRFATIGHMNYVNSRHCLEQLQKHMRGATNAS